MPRKIREQFAVDIPPGAYHARTELDSGYVQDLSIKSSPTPSPGLDLILPRPSGNSRPAGRGRGHWLNYTLADGLADNSAYDLTLDRKNRLWIATSGGVSRFDGNQFVNLSKEDHPHLDAAKSVLVDSKGHLWVGTGHWNSTGFGAIHYDGRRVVAADPPLRLHRTRDPPVGRSRRNNRRSVASFRPR